MIPNDKLHAQDLYEMTMTTLTNNLTIHIDGYACDTEMALSVVTKAALENSSIAAVCEDLKAVADDNTLREQLNAVIDVTEMARQEVEMNAALASGLPHKLPRGGVEVAIDFHNEPFYGKTAETRTYTCRDRSQKGSTRFFRIASASVMWRGIRLTLALTYVLPEYSTLDVLKRLLQRLTHLGFHATVLYLDKGFCSGKVITYLQRQRQAAIIACPQRGETGGTRALCQGRQSYRTRYTFTDGTEVDMAVVATLPRGKDGKRRRKWLLFVVIGLDWSPKTIMRCYRRRFGIESTYRQMRQLRVVSSSRNPALKFFFLALSLVLVNLWALLRWHLFRRPGRGPRTILSHAFSLHRFRGLLRRAIEQLYEGILAVQTTAFPQFVNY